MDREYLASQELVETFIAESSDFLDEFEVQLIALADAENNPQAPAGATDSLMNNIFRLIHTIKGSAGSFGFKNISALAHRAENLLDDIRKKTIKLDRGRLELLQQSIDLFRILLSHIQKSKHDMDGSCQGDVLDLMMKLEQALKDRDPGGPNALSAMKELSSGFFVFDDDAPPPAAAPENSPSFKITDALRTSFLQESDETLQKVELSLLALATAKGLDANEHVEEAFRRIHSFKGNCGFMGYKDLSEVSHALETHLERLKINPALITDKLTETILRIVDAVKTTLYRIGQSGDDCMEDRESLIEYLESVLPVAPGRRAQIDLPEANAAVQEMPQLKALKSTATLENPASLNPVRNDIRVDLKKLDALINLVGELVIAETMVSGSLAAVGIENEQLDRAFHHLRRTTLDLQDISMSVRMVPVAQTFRKMTRLVHDTTQKLGKKSRLVLKGEDTEVDKTVIEQIADPLVHCVRNSIDHGLEMPDARRESGKDEMGTITLEARHEEGEIWIIIQDDGGGLRRDKILKRARERNLPGIERESTLTDSEVFNYIFEPGFSTAEQVTDVSGRGVGMDVVRKNIEKIKGRVRIESTAGQGTQIIFEIPLTLAIIDGMMVKVGDAKYTIPLLNIQESIILSPERVVMGPDGLKMVDLRSKFIPIVQLGHLFGQKDVAPLPDDGLVVIVEVTQNSLALHVDEILGQQQTVVKALPNSYKRSRAVSGCTILGNGEVSLILDVGGINDCLGEEYQNLISKVA
ncbi:MAG TPA: chemotaxis protein CheA [Oligoflexus sp.]|uniref:chemotaxis protein CheA n=1 Tax=Oligoflexus sp. TaxID=1971216 RepID=UPI002D5B84E8|nr:chemotaxis protein CheA [Oligoflexus sp.]HYX33151.1 chemotaxis protein CheA [Oligoflexus sp.]